MAKKVMRVSDQQEMQEAPVVSQPTEEVTTPAEKPKKVVRSEPEAARIYKTPGKTKVVHGSIVNPENAGLRFVLALNNLAGKVEDPLYSVFDKKWSKARVEAKGWYATRTGAYKLGAVNTIAVQSDVWIIGMLCQDEKMQTNISSLDACLKRVKEMAKYEKSSVHVSTLLTNSIPELSDLIKKHLINEGISTYFYDGDVMIKYGDVT